MEKNLYLTGDGPVVDGRALKSLTTRNIYLCPIQKDIDLDEVTSSEMSSKDNECMEDCVVCGQSMPLTKLIDHAEKCGVKENSDANSLEFDSAGWDLLNGETRDWDPPAVLNVEGNIIFLYFDICLISE